MDKLKQFSGVSGMSKDDDALLDIHASVDDEALLKNVKLDRNTKRDKLRFFYTFKRDVIFFKHCVNRVIESYGKSFVNLSKSLMLRIAMNNLYVYERQVCILFDDFGKLFKIIDCDSIVQINEIYLHERDLGYFGEKVRKGGKISVRVIGLFTPNAVDDIKRIYYRSMLELGYRPIL